MRLYFLVYVLPESFRMSDEVINRLAQRLLKCPFDPELFESLLALETHLSESHGAQICHRERVPRRAQLEDTERPTRLTICGHCCEFMVPHTVGRNPTDELVKHIAEKHPDPSGIPPRVTFLVTSDPEKIDHFMVERTFQDEYCCRHPACAGRFEDSDSVATHWADQHCDHPTAEEVQGALAADPGRFSVQLAEIFSEIELESVCERHSYQEPDDGYRIRHMPCVPRVRSRPSEFIVYVEGELSRLPDDELLDMDIDGFAPDDADLLGGVWADGRTQCASLELRFCNIVDGYIPLVKEVCGILPPLTADQTIAVSWHNDQGPPFPCKVNRSKRAIYNLQGRLKKMFGLHSGVRLYITRIGPLRYELRARRQPHIVPNCKIFVSDGAGGWHVEFRNEMVEWETGGDVFRHQITFEEMDALHAEARRTNLSVRDAVHLVMRKNAHTQPWHVRDVYEAVFPFRTCSLAAVWAQFRPEHECYVRVAPSRYQFDASRPFPAVRVTAPLPRTQPDAISAHGRLGHSAPSRLRILVHWSQILGEPCCPEQEFRGWNAGVTQARFLGSLIHVFPQLATIFTRNKVSRHALSGDPRRDFVNQETGKVYPHQPVPGTNLYVSTNTSNDEKRDDILSLADGLRHAGLRFPVGSVEVFVTPGLSRTALLNSI